MRRGEQWLVEIMRSACCFNEEHDSDVKDEGVWTMLQIVFPMHKITIPTNTLRPQVLERSGAHHLPLFPFHQRYQSLSSDSYGSHSLFQGSGIRPPYHGAHGSYHGRSRRRRLLLGSLLMRLLFGLLFSTIASEFFR